MNGHAERRNVVFSTSGGLLKDFLKATVSADPSRH